MTFLVRLISFALVILGTNDTMNNYILNFIELH